MVEASDRVENRGLRVLHMIEMEGLSTKQEQASLQQAGDAALN